MTEILLGVGSSLLTESITWLNTKLSDTPLKGMGAFIVSLGLALVIASIKTIYLGQFDFEHMAVTSATIWTTSQIWFHLIASKVGFTVKN